MVVEEVAVRVRNERPARLPAGGGADDVDADGWPHTTPVWCEFDGVHVVVNAMRGFLKERNMRCDPLSTKEVREPRLDSLSSR
jgi:hypothetical protein